MFTPFILAFAASFGGSDAAYYNKSAIASDFETPKACKAEAAKTAKFEFDGKLDKAFAFVGNDKCFETIFGSKDSKSDKAVQKFEDAKDAKVAFAQRFEACFEVKAMA